MLCLINLIDYISNYNQYHFLLPSFLLPPTYNSYILYKEYIYIYPISELSEGFPPF